MTFYVSMTDTALSNWGQSRAKVNRLIFECETREEAKTVQRNAESRTDQTDVRFHEEMPTFPDDEYFVQVKNKSEYPRWFEPNSF